MYGYKYRYPALAGRLVDSAALAEAAAGTGTGSSTTARPSVVVGTDAEPEANHRHNSSLFVPSRLQQLKSSTSYPPTILGEHQPGSSYHYSTCASAGTGGMESGLPSPVGPGAIGSSGSNSACVPDGGARVLTLAQLQSVLPLAKVLTFGVQNVFSPSLCFTLDMIIMLLIMMLVFNIDGCVFFFLKNCICMGGMA